MRIGGLDRFFQVNVNTLATIPLKGILVRYYLPLEKGYPLGFNKLKFPSLKDDLYHAWLKLAQWFWRKRFLNDPTPFLHFCYYLLFEEDLALYLNTLEFPSPKDNLYQV
jgi:hypothetical protein